MSHLTTTRRPARHRAARGTDVIYLDHPATTPCDERVVSEMLPWLTVHAANAGQLGHVRGRRAAQVVEEARAELLTSVGMLQNAEAVLTSGATEANNLALLGVARTVDPTARIVVSAVEHASVLAPARELERQGHDVRIVPVDEQGRIRLDELQTALQPGAAIVSVQAVNNELGILQPLEQVAEQARRAGAILHVDAVQGFGKIPIDADALGIDLLTVSGHKIYGPPGTGALLGRDRALLGSIAPMLHGGGQQRGIRPGTVNVPGAVGIGTAARIARMSLASEQQRSRRLQQRLEERLLSAFPDAVINGAGAERVPTITSVSIPGIEASTLLAATPSVVAGTTSACSAGGTSHVLRAIGLDPTSAGSTMRLGIGRGTTERQVDDAVDALVHAASELACTTDPVSTMLLERW